MSGRAAHVGLAGSQGHLKTRKQAGVQEPGWRVETYKTAGAHICGLELIDFER